jgi:dTDP-4-dehydrorhamnose 3,5-epimerase
VQANLSTSAGGVLRGLHLHQRQLDHWVVASGRAFVVLVDVRPMLRGEGRPLVETRELVADEWVDIPIGVAHGFLALEPLQLIYLVTNEYDGSDELGFAWDDPLAAVPWPAVPESPDGLPILSDRDRTNPSLTELVERLRTSA